MSGTDGGLGPGRPPTDGDGPGLTGPPPGWSAPPGPAWLPPGPPPAGSFSQAAHKPGAVPLRPLRLGDILDGAFAIVRYNPGATVGSSVVVAGVAMLVPLAVTALLTLTVGLSLDRLESGDVGLAQATGLIAAYGSLLVGMLLQWLGNLLVTGMNAHVALAAAEGRRLTLGQAWAATRGRRWRLLLLVLVLSSLWAAAAALVVGVVVVAAFVLPVGWAVTVGVLVALAALLASCFCWVRLYYLAVPPLMLEGVGVRGALGRAWVLTRGQFWRTFGIALLTLVMASVVGGIISTPIAVLGQVALVADPGGAGLLLYTVAAALAQVVSAALVAPFVTTVTSLQYLDQRVRKEAFDVELLRRSGMLAP